MFACHYVSGRTFRQLDVLDLGRAHPALLMTNERWTPARLITRYDQRRLIENAISDAVRSITT